MFLFLFDIDGTLIDSGGAGTRSLDLAFRELFSVENAFYGIGMAGRTDLQIMREVLTRQCIFSDENLEALINQYLAYLMEEINNDKKHVKPGIHELLDSLATIKDVKVGLLTGNLEQGARIKLGSFGMNRYFETGAFGGDDEDRDRLLPFAIKRFEELYTAKIGFHECVVIGDTPRDVHCAKPYGAKSVGVATGHYSADALRKAGADYVYEDLSNHSGFLQIFN